jgi:hypothetical protein
VAFLVLAAQLPLWSYDQSPSDWQVLPEATWALASGGGTWVTEVQITSFATTAADINVYFYYNGGYTGPFPLYAGLEQYHSVRYSNILATIDSLDSGDTVYYGKAGAIWFWTTSTSSAIQVQAKTVNGNYGKTFPGLGVVDANTAAQGRDMVIEDVVQDTTYRTNIGVFNSSIDATYTVYFTIVDSADSTVGSEFSVILAPRNFRSFNPFNLAGVPSGTYSNCWLYISVTAGGTATRAVFCYGSLANNYTNDTYALIARMFN